MFTKMRTIATASVLALLSASPLFAGQVSNGIAMNGMALNGLAVTAHNKIRSGPQTAHFRTQIICK